MKNELKTKDKLLWIDFNIYNQHLLIQNRIKNIQHKKNHIYLNLLKFLYNTHNVYDTTNIQNKQ